MRIITAITLQRAQKVNFGSVVDQADLYLIWCYDVLQCRLSPKHNSVHQRQQQPKKYLLIAVSVVVGSLAIVYHCVLNAGMEKNTMTLLSTFFCSTLRDFSSHSHLQLGTFITSSRTHTIYVHPIEYD